MNWVEDFYSKQEEWLGVYTSEVNEYHRNKALALQSLAGVAPKSVLELGAGGGQTAFATSRLGYTVTAIELLERPTLFAKSLSERATGGSMRVIKDDFYSVQLDESFDHDVSSVALYPGLVRTEGVMRYAEAFDMSNSESPLFVGRSVAALASDPKIISKSGNILRTADLAQVYGFTDVDGKQPRPLTLEEA